MTSSWPSVTLYWRPPSMMIAYMIRFPNSPSKVHDTPGIAADAAKASSVNLQRNSSPLV